MSNAFEKMREELAKRDASGVPLYAIRAETGVGKTITVFTWRGNPETGIARAKREAVEFGMTDLCNFTAEKV